MEKTSRKSKKPSPKNTSLPSGPVFTKATTKNRDKALHDVIGMWADREETKDIKTFRQALWREKTN